MIPGQADLHFGIPALSLTPWVEHPNGVWIYRPSACTICRDRARSADQVAEPPLARLDYETGSVPRRPRQSSLVTRPASNTVGDPGGSYPLASSGLPGLYALARDIPRNVAGCRSRTYVLSTSPRAFCVYLIDNIQSNCRK